MLFLCIKWICLFFFGSQTHVSYWIWAGITTHDIPYRLDSPNLYVYQGLINCKGKYGTYERIGLYPHPIKCKSLFFSYRVQGELPQVSQIISIFQKNAAHWKKYHPVTGLQLDFDSPTSKLLVYSTFLQKLRKQLPSHYSLSVTGLGDWIIYGNQQDLRNITKFTDEIIFQLYQGRFPLPNLNFYIKRLSQYPLPFYIGILLTHPVMEDISFLKRNKNFKGVVYFIQKGRRCL